MSTDIHSQVKDLVDSLGKLYVAGAGTPQGPQLRALRDWALGLQKDLLLESLQENTPKFDAATAALKETTVAAQEALADLNNLKTGLEKALKAASALGDVLGVATNLITTIV